MAENQHVTGKELKGVKAFVQASYPGRKIVEVLAEKWKKHPIESGLELQNVGLALIVRSGRNDLYQRVINDIYDCFIDTFHEPNLNSGVGILLTVVILEKYNWTKDHRPVEKIVLEDKGFSITASLRPTPGDTYEIRLHELSHASGTSTGFSNSGLQFVRNVNKKFAKECLATHLETYSKLPLTDFIRLVEDYKKTFSEHG